MYFSSISLTSGGSDFHSFVQTSCRCKGSTYSPDTSVTPVTDLIGTLSRLSTSFAAASGLNARSVVSRGLVTASSAASAPRRSSLKRVRNRSGSRAAYVSSPPMNSSRIAKITRRRGSSSSAAPTSSKNSALSFQRSENDVNTSSNWSKIRIRIEAPPLVVAGYGRDPRPRLPVRPGIPVLPPGAQRGGGPLPGDLAVRGCLTRPPPDQG